MCVHIVCMWMCEGETSPRLTVPDPTAAVRLRISPSNYSRVETIFDSDLRLFLLRVYRSRVFFFSLSYRQRCPGHAAASAVAGAPVRKRGNQIPRMDLYIVVARTDRAPSGERRSHK